MRITCVYESVSLWGIAEVEMCHLLAPSTNECPKYPVLQIVLLTVPLPSAIVIGVTTDYPRKE